MNLCVRCGKPFTPEWIAGIRRFSRCCEDCQIRNMMDGLGLPTPPCLLDRHTETPTLTEEEFRRKLKEDWKGKAGT